MKSTKLQLVTATALVFAATLLAQDSPTKEPEELKRLRQQYNQKRVAALKPINESYRQQLEQLMKSFTTRNQLEAALEVKKELENVSTLGGQEELRDALLNWNWSSTGFAKETDVFLTFNPDGTSSHRGGRQKWTITGPREIKLDDGSRIFILRFDQNLQNYKSISGPELHGRRVAK